MEKNFFKYMFFFALGSIIALFVIACDVQADTFNYYDTLSINNVYDQILCSNNISSTIECFNANGLMYGKATKNYTFVQGSIYTVSFTSSMEYYAIHGQIQTTEIRQNGILFWNSTHTNFQYASCIANTSTYITQDIDIDTLHVDTTYTCATTMNDNFTSFDYINQSSAYNWIGAKLTMTSVEINSIAEGNAGIIENANNNQQQTNERLDNIQNSITDSTIDNDNVIGTFDTLNGLINDSGVITSLMVLPVNLFTQINIAVQNECTTFNLGNLFGHSLTLPCIKLENTLGSTLWTMIDILFSGLFVYHIAKVFIRMFDNMTSLSEGDVIDD